MFMGFSKGLMANSLDGGIVAPKLGGCVWSVKGIVEVWEGA
jgi:hypothetical protein